MYISHETVNWVVPLVLPYLLSSGFILDFWFYFSYFILLYYICIHPGLPLVYYPQWSPALIILYHACSLLDITYCLSTCSCMLVLTPWFSLHAFQLGFIDTRVPDYARHLAFITPLVGEFLIPWICVFRSRSLELVDSPGCWSEMRSRRMDHRQTVWGPILPGPLLGSRVFLFWLVSAFCTVHICISLYIFAFSPISDVIFL